MSAYILRVSGAKEPCFPQARGREISPKTFSLEELQAIVGGYIELVKLTDDVVMIVDEEGKFKDYPMNYAATALWAKCHPGYSDWIAGDVVVCSTDMID